MPFRHEVRKDGARQRQQASGLCNQDDAEGSNDRDTHRRRAPAGLPVIEDRLAPRPGTSPAEHGSLPRPQIAIGTSKRPSAPATARFSPWTCADRPPGGDPRRSTGSAWWERVTNGHSGPPGGLKSSANKGVGPKISSRGNTGSGGPVEVNSSGPTRCLRIRDRGRRRGRL